MALDGMCLSLLTEETKKLILGSRVEKINQPSRDELVFSMRGEQGSYKLLISAKAEMARAQITALPPENPKQAPMLCMLLRKLIGSGRLIAIRQNGFERVLFFDFRTVNEFGDEVTYTLISEIMGRYSNIILTDGGGKIIESIKRVGLDKSSVRQILPGLTYVLPPSQDKIPLGENYDEAAERICNFPRDIVLYKAIGEVLEGVSPILTREISYRALKGCDGIISALTLEDKENLKSELKKLNETVKSQHTVPTMVFREDGSPLDFSFIDICQYEGVSQKKNFGSLWELLDGFYGTRDEAERMKQKMADFSRNVTSKIERIEKKLALQRNELLECENKDDLKLKGDLLSSYMHTLKRGMTETEIVNFYDPLGGTVKVALDPILTPVGNVQKYYKDYRRMDTAKKELTRLISHGEEELGYLYSVYDSMLRAKGAEELTAIRQELSESGYLKQQGKKKREKIVTVAPLKYISDDGFTILCGRNNVGNDKLTLKIANKQDIWFHTQKLPGSHTVILKEGKEIPERTLLQAAIIAVTNSSAAKSAKVSVDYTAIKYVKKPVGAKPGMVIYTDFKTAVVTPDPDLLERIKA